MGQRRELRRPAGVRKMLADKRREVTRLRREQKDLLGDLHGAVEKNIVLSRRFKILLRVGKILLVRDLLK